MRWLAEDHGLPAAWEAAAAQGSQPLWVGTAGGETRRY